LAIVPPQRLAHAFPSKGMNLSRDGGVIPVL
jgi:hypothetical protein